VPSTAKAPTAYQQERQETINWLVAHNYPVLPVAPVQEPYSSGNHKIISENPSKGIWSHCPLSATLQPIPLYTGKNPSYLDAYGKPHLVNHRQYQNKLPSAQDLKKWFANPLNGVGTLGGWNNTVWLDFDVKQFPSQEECNKAALQVAARAQQQTGFDALLEESHSGGWRVGVRVHAPGFTNFALTQGGNHVGEALGMGRFTVLAPTIGNSGNSYKSHQRCVPPLVESLESLGIYSTKNLQQGVGSRVWGVGEGEDGDFHPNLPKDSTTTDSLAKNLCTNLQPPHPTPGAPIPPHPSSEDGVSRARLDEPAQSPVQPPIRKLHLGASSIPSTLKLEKLGNKLSQEILAGACPTGDRSSALATAIQEWYGWENWCNATGVCYSGSTQELAHIAGAALHIESDRVERILNPQKAFIPEQCQPAALIKGGEESCWKKIYRLDKASFLAKCPAIIKNAIMEEWRRTQDKGTGVQGRTDAQMGRRTKSIQTSISTPPEYKPLNLRDGALSLDKSQPQLDAVSLPACVREILHRYDSESLQTAALMELGESCAKPYSDIEKLARVVRLEDELTLEASDTIIPLRTLLKTCRKRLNLHRYLARPLADALIAAANAMPTAPEYLLNTLIPVSASRIGVSSRIVIKAESHYIQPCIFWSANVADSGQAKTPPQALIMEAMEDMEQLAREAHSKRLADWEACSDKNKEAKPIETRRILNNTTMAQKIRIHAENPRGLDRIHR
jgi:hypothetical protein